MKKQVIATLLCGIIMSIGLVGCGEDTTNTVVEPTNMVEEVMEGAETGATVGENAIEEKEPTEEINKEETTSTIDETNVNVEPETNVEIQDEMTIEDETNVDVNVEPETTIEETQEVLEETNDTTNVIDGAIMGAGASTETDIEESTTSETTTE